MIFFISRLTFIVFLKDFFFLKECLNYSLIFSRDSFGVETVLLWNTPSPCPSGRFSSSTVNESSSVRSLWMHRMWVGKLQGLVSSFSRLWFPLCSQFVFFLNSTFDIQLRRWMRETLVIADNGVRWSVDSYLLQGFLPPHSCKESVMNPMELRLRYLVNTKKDLPFQLVQIWFSNIIFLEFVERRLVLLLQFFISHDFNVWKKCWRTEKKP